MTDPRPETPLADEPATSGDERPPVVVVTADSSLRTAVAAVRAGAADFLGKPYEIEELRWVVERTLEGDDLRRQNRKLRAEVRRLGGERRLLGESPAMRRFTEELERVGPTEASVLIRGETGTGKELAARSLHELSTVAQGPFVALNCAAVPESLLESELFGHRKGAFTGADRDRTGRFREAHRGTLFLDEIGDMPAAAQAKLLRVLQERIVEPLGGGKPVPVEVRVVAATHRDLEALCRGGQFRDDLYYRLRVVELALPPLRERGDDILLLASEFLRHAGCALALSPAVESALRVYPWPGNVRELRNAMERAAIFSRGSAVEPEVLPAELRAPAAGSPVAGSPVEGMPVGGLFPGPTVQDATPSDFRTAKQEILDRFERDFLTAALRRHRGNVSRAARESGLHRQNLQKKLRQLGIDPGEFRGT